MSRATHGLTARGGNSAGCSWVTRNGGSSTSPADQSAVQAPTATTTRRARTTPPEVPTRTRSGPRTVIASTRVRRRTAAPWPTAAAVSADTARSAWIRPERSGWYSTGPENRSPGQRSVAASAANQRCAMPCAVSISATAAVRAGSP